MVDVSRSRLWASGISLTNFLVVKSNPNRFPSEFSIRTLASVSREICTVREPVWLIELTLSSSQPFEKINGLDMLEASNIAPTIKPVIKRVVNINRCGRPFVARALDWSASVLACSLSSAKTIGQPGRLRSSHCPGFTGVTPVPLLTFKTATASRSAACDRSN